MPSQVGKQPAEAAVIQQALALEMDCVAAMSAAAERTDDAVAQKIFARVSADCERHVRIWQGRLHALGEAPGAASHATAWFNRVKVLA